MSLELIDENGAKLKKLEDEHCLFLNDDLHTDAELLTDRFIGMIQTNANANHNMVAETKPPIDKIHKCFTCFQTSRRGQHSACHKVKVQRQSLTDTFYK